MKQKSNSNSASSLPSLGGAGGGLKITIPKKNESDVGINFAVTYGVPMFNSIPPADSSYGYVYLNGMINY